MKNNITKSVKTAKAKAEAGQPTQVDVWALVMGDNNLKAISYEMKWLILLAIEDDINSSCKSRKRIKILSLADNEDYRIITKGGK